MESSGHELERLEQSVTQRAKTRDYTQLTSEQRLGEVQYHSLLIENPGSSHDIDVSLGYRRSIDFDEGNNPGQDFATVRGGGGYVVGVVADGVSQSFYGHLAARYLSEWLLEKLWRERVSPPSGDRLQEECKELEKVFATEVVDKVQIPDHLPTMLRQSLETTRQQGSQAVFAAFVLDARENRLHLYQAGDIDALIHYPDKFAKPVQAPPNGRWSSAGKSEMHLRAGTYEGASGIVIRSDGAGKEWGESLRDSAFDRSAFNALAQIRAGIDDVSFVAARWGEVLERPSRIETKPVRRTEPVVPPPQEEAMTLPGARRYVAPPPEPTRRHRPYRHLGPPPRSKPLNQVLAVAALVASIAVVGVVVGIYLLRNQPPHAKDLIAWIDADSPTVTLTATDKDGDDLTFEIKKAPIEGTLGKVGPPTCKETNSMKCHAEVTFTPGRNSDGTDTFTYRASDGASPSDPATVKIYYDWSRYGRLDSRSWWIRGD